VRFFSGFPNKSILLGDDTSDVWFGRRMKFCIVGYEIKTNKKKIEKQKNRRKMLV